MDKNERITGSAIEAFQELRDKFQRDIGFFLEDNPTARLYTRQDVLNAWLQWNGILGFTLDILEITKVVHKE